MKKILILLVIILNALHTGAYAEDYVTEEVEFFSHGNKLAGTIVFPAQKEVRAAVVFVHGSGKQTRNLHWGQRFASEGVAALVYDKRGAGHSAGVYESDQSVSEKNINLLADDSLAALNVLHKHPKLKEIPLGLTGISQAG